MADTETYGTYTKVSDNSGLSSIYKFTGLKLSENTIKNNGKSALLSIKSIEVNTETNITIKYERGGTDNITGDQAEKLMKLITSKSINETSIELRTNTDFFTATNTSNKFRNSNGAEYTLYNVSNQLYLVNNNTGDAQEVINTIDGKNLGAEDCTMLLYDSVEKKWKKIEEASDGSLRIGGEFIKSNVPIKNALGYNDYISESNEAALETEILNNLGNRINAQDFPKKGKSFIKWVESINIWLKSIENICKFAELPSFQALRRI